MKLIVLIAVASLSGCSTLDDTPSKTPYVPMSKTTYTYIQPMAELTPEQIAKRDKYNQDMNVCKYEAVKATGSSQRGYTVYSTIFNDMGDTFRQAEIIGLCMKSKGYAG